MTIFLTTHSNHLLDLTITDRDDISIFVFEKLKTESKSKIREVKNTDLQILHQLGVHNSSVFMANCSIWVEGITDRLYLRAYLKAYFEKKKVFWKEDRHYAFFEYAGSNLKHYDFSDQKTENISASFIANRVLVIADQDLGKEEKHKLFQEELKENYYVLPVREIENLLSPKQIKEALSEINFQGVQLSKEDLDKVEFKESEYQKKYLRKYIVDILKKKKIAVPKSLDLDKDTEKTFSTKHKEKLVAIVCKNLKWEDMSEEAKKLTIRACLEIQSSRIV